LQSRADAAAVNGGGVGGFNLDAGVHLPLM